jgi:hypothetical protein
MVQERFQAESKSGRVGWATNEQLFLQLTAPNTVSVRDDFDERDLERLKPFNPRVHPKIWRW